MTFSIISEYRYAERHYVEFHLLALYAECGYAECRYAECRGAHSWILHCKCVQRSNKIEKKRIFIFEKKTFFLKNGRTCSYTCPAVAPRHSP